MEANQTKSSGTSLDTITEQIQEEIEHGKYTWSELQDAVVSKTREVVETTDDYVRENPWKVVGIAAGVGLLLGFLLTPKSKD